MRPFLPAEHPNHRATDLGFLLYSFLSSSSHESHFPRKVGALPCSRGVAPPSLPSLVYNLVFKGVILYFESPQAEERQKPRPPTRRMRQGSLWQVLLADSCCARAWTPWFNGCWMCQEQICQNRSVTNTASKIGSYILLHFLKTQWIPR